MRIKIDGQIHKVDHVVCSGYLDRIKCGGIEFELAQDIKTADASIQKMWLETANEDPEEFVALVGAQIVVDYAFHEWDLHDWVEIQEAASTFTDYGCVTREVNVCGRLLKKRLGYTPTIAYEQKEHLTLLNNIL